MTKRFFMLLAVAMAAVVVHAEDFTANGIKYTGDESTKTATVTGTEDGFNQTDVVIPEVVNGYTVMKIGDDAFSWNLNLKTVELPNTVKTIAPYAFSEDENLESIKLPNMLDSIGAAAFLNCEKLKDISIPSSVKFIGKSAFCGCKSIETIVVPEGIDAIKKDCYASCEALKSVTLPSMLKTIEEGVFMRCGSLTSIKLPETVESLGYSCFERSGLTSVHIPASVKKVESIQDTHWPFCACFQLTKITIAEDNPVYDSRNGCNAIIETATNKLIEGCAGTVIPENVVTIGASAFEICPIKTIEIPNSVTNIEKFAFGGCTGLTAITIPASVTTIGYDAFSGCDQLKTFTSLIEEPFETSASSFGIHISGDNGKTLYVPKGCTNKYKATEGWNWFQYIREIGEAGPTGIRPVHTPSAATDSPWYTLDGHRVKRPAAKGIYINNGRKVVVR